MQSVLVLIKQKQKSEQNHQQKLDKILIGLKDLFLSKKCSRDKDKRKKRNLKRSIRSIRNNINIVNGREVETLLIINIEGDLSKMISLTNMKREKKEIDQNQSKNKNIVAEEIIKAHNRKREKNTENDKSTKTQNTEIHKDMKNNTKRENQRKINTTAKVIEVIHINIINSKSFY